MTLDALITIVTIPLACYAGWRWLQRRWESVKGLEPDPPRVRPAIMSRPIEGDGAIAPRFTPVSEPVSDRVSPREIQRNSTETPSSDFIDPALVEILARLVHRGELGKTAAIKIGLQRESGARYQAGKAAMDAALEQLDPKVKYRREPDEAASIAAWRERMGLTE